MGLNDNIRIEGEKVIAFRGWKIPPGSTSVLATSKLWGQAIGQDGYAYMVEGAFSHPYVEHTVERDSSGGLYVGCANERLPGSRHYCGWSENIHTPRITHIECDNCDKVIEMISKVEATFFDVTPAIEVRRRRFFCSGNCVSLWLSTH